MLTTVDYVYVNKDATELPFIQPYVKHIYIHGTQIRYLPQLPEGVETLWAYDTLLEYIQGTLPSTITDLRLHTLSLSSLPPNLTTLWSHMPSLPRLPDSLTEIWCQSQTLQNTPIHLQTMIFSLPEGRVQLYTRQGQSMIYDIPPDMYMGVIPFYCKGSIKI